MICTSLVNSQRALEYDQLGAARHLTDFKTRPVTCRTAPSIKEVSCLEVWSHVQGTPFQAWSQESRTGLRLAYLNRDFGEGMAITVFDHTQLTLLGLSTASSPPCPERSE